MSGTSSAPSAATVGPGDQLLLHATTVALGDRAALLLGPSGAGKSDLALRFLADDGRWPAPHLPRRLVADDQTLLSVDQGRLIARAPATIAGRLEVRGVGIVAVPSLAAAPVVLAVTLADRETIERLPDPAHELARHLGVAIQHRSLDPRDASAAIKLALILVQIA